MKTIILFGLGPAGLFLGRQLSKSTINIVGIGRYDDVGLYSKHIQGNIAETKTDIIRVIDNVLDQSLEKPQAIICSDQYLTLMLDEFPEIFDMLEFIGSHRKTLELINNKSKVSKYCSNINIKTPKTYLYDEILDIKKDCFPLIFKLNTKEINATKNPIGKIKIINNPAQLDQIISKINESTIKKENIVIQSYIEGNNSNQFSYGGFLREGKEVAGIVVNQIGQYPQGISSMVIETMNISIRNEIIRCVEKFAGPIKYSGFLEMEFKVSEENIYLMDINPRPWGWVSILAKKYENFHSIFSNKDKNDLIKNEMLVAWKSPMRNLIGYIKNPNNIRLTEKFSKEQISRLKYALDIHDKSDRLPSYAIIKVGFQKIIKKCWRKR